MWKLRSRFLFGFGFCLVRCIGGIARGVLEVDEFLQQLTKLFDFLLFVVIEAVAVVVGTVAVAVASSVTVAAASVVE